MCVRGIPIPGAENSARLSGLPAVALLVFLIGGYGGELGWRGFALARLQQRFGPLGGSLLLALPAFGVIQICRGMTIPMIPGGFLFGLACGSLVLARVAHKTGGSVLAAALWHATCNLTSATSAGGGFIASFTTTCVMLWALVLLALEWRRPRATSLLLVAQTLPYQAEGAGRRTECSVSQGGPS